MTTRRRQSGQHPEVPGRSAPAATGLHRRELLSRALQLGGGALAFGALDLADPFVRLAHAAEAAAKPGTLPTLTDRNYIFVYFSGGWDILLSLDPRDPDVFTNDKLGSTQIQPGYSLLDDPPNGGKILYAQPSKGPKIAFGPYIGDLAKHVDKLAIVRGMSMDTLTHEVGRRRFLTGKPPSGLLARGSSAATWLAAWLGQSATIPQLAVRVESYNKELPNFASALKVNSVPDLVRALKQGASPQDPKVDALIDAALTSFASCPDAKASATWSKAEASRQKARQMVLGGYDALFDFQAKTEAMAALRTHYGIAATGAAALTTPEAQGALAVTALASGLARVCSIQVPVLDAHFDTWASDHGPDQQRGFNLIARILEDLESRPHADGGTMLDRTVVVGFSEFSRTPMLNARGGRDHALTNACVLAGAGIRGGQVVGRSADIALAPMPTNLVTGLPDTAKGEIIKPEHIYRTLFWDLGVTADVADLRVEPLRALLKSNA